MDFRTGLERTLLMLTLCEQAASVWNSSPRKETAELLVGMNTYSECHEKDERPVSAILHSCEDGYSTNQLTISMDTALDEFYTHPEWQDNKVRIGFWKWIKNNSCNWDWDNTKGLQARVTFKLTANDFTSSKIMCNISSIWHLSYWLITPQMYSCFGVKYSKYYFQM